MNCNTIFQQQWTDEGLCFAFNSEEFVKENGQLWTDTTGEAGGLYLQCNIQQEEYVYGTHSSAGLLVTTASVPTYLYDHLLTT